MEDVTTEQSEAETADARLHNRGAVALQRCAECFAYRPWTIMRDNRCPECAPPLDKRFPVRGAVRRG